MDFRIKETLLLFSGDEVNHTLEVDGYSDGVYIDLITNGILEYPGIEQIRVIKVVESGTMNITIRYSTLEETLQYIDDNKVEIIE
jgi:hypothetical protein